MNKKKVLMLLASVSIVGSISYLVYNFDPFALNDDRILKDTRNAYRTIKFENEVILKRREIQDFADFLLRHTDKFRNYNTHKEFRKIQLAEGRWTSHYKNAGDCFGMPTFHESFINTYIPPELVDSLLYYTEGLRNEIILGLSVCNNQYEKNISSVEGSVSFNLNHEQKDKLNHSYYVYHGIIQNRKFKTRKTLNSIYDYGLAKDTTLTNKLKYTITISPYSGF